MLKRLKEVFGLNKGVDPQQAPRNLTAKTQRRTSSCELREAQIFLHDAVRRRSSVESETTELASTRRRSSAFEFENMVRYYSSFDPSRDEEETENNMKAIPDLNGVKYQRYMNVYAAPPRQVDKFVAPVFPKSEAGVQFLKKALLDNFVFGGLTEEEEVLLINAMQRYRFKADEVIIKQGDAADYFYVLRQGKVQFIVDSKKVREASDGVSFGELALLHNAPRSASVIAVTECFTYRVDQCTFRALLASHTLGLEKARVELLRHVSIFKDIDTAALAKIADAMTPVSVPDGKMIIRKGDVGRIFYIIQRGKVKISEVSITEESCPVIKNLERGDFFGERALITGERRSANATAIGHCTLLCISKETFETIMGSLEDLINQTSITRMLKNVPLFANANLEPYEWELISGVVSNCVFNRGTILVERGQPVADFRPGLYLVRGGEITISLKEKTHHLRRNDTFGEDLILMHQGHAPLFSAVVTEDAICNMISVEDICETLGGLDRLQQTSFPRHSKLDASITLDTITKIRILGSGTYGQVWLAKHKIYKTAFALKILNKREVIKNKLEEVVIQEKNLMESLHHPFIIKLVNTFQNKESLFIVTNFVQGGELFSILHTPNSNGISEDSARFYAANIYEGLLHMHERQILYRDLKPENILIGKDGYCILIDLGFAKLISGKTYTLCGTPFYMAPEIILSRGYDKSADNWSFGVLVYEMIIGFSPFYATNIDQPSLFKRIVEGNFRFPYQTRLSSDSKDLIYRLLILNPTKRLGSLSGGDYDVRSHPWLSSLSRIKMLTKQIEPPWKPRITSPTDSSNFDCRRNLKKKHDTNLPVLGESEQALFCRF